MLTARDLMKLGTKTLSFDDTVPTAIERLSMADTHFAVVCASRDRMNGVVTEGNLVKIFLRYKLNPAKEALIYYRELMDPVQLIHENEIFPEVVKKILTAVGNVVFVINDKGEFIGHITAKDVLPCLEEKIANSTCKVRTSSPPKEELDRLNSEMYLYESFFAKSPFMMHSANKDGVIQMANEMLHTVLGYEYGELIGKTIFDIYPKESHQAAAEALKKIISKGFHNVLHAKMVRKNNSMIDVEMVSRLLENQNEKPIGTMTVSRPIDMSVLLTSLPNI